MVPSRRPAARLTNRAGPSCRVELPFVALQPNRARFPTT